MQSRKEGAGRETQHDDDSVFLAGESHVESRGEEEEKRSHTNLDLNTFSYFIVMPHNAKCRVRIS